MKQEKLQQKKKRLADELNVLENVAQKYAGRTIDNIIQNYRLIIKELDARIQPGEGKNHKSVTGLLILILAMATTACRTTKTVETSAQCESAYAQKVVSGSALSALDSLSSALNLKIDSMTCTFTWSLPQTAESLQSDIGPTSEASAAAKPDPGSEAASFTGASQKAERNAASRRPHSQTPAKGRLDIKLYGIGLGASSKTGHHIEQSSSDSSAISGSSKNNKEKKVAKKATPFSTKVAILAALAIAIFLYLYRKRNKS